MPCVPGCQSAATLEALGVPSTADFPCVQGNISLEAWPTGQLTEMDTSNVVSTVH